MSEQMIVTVSQVNQYLKELIDAQRVLHSIYIKGEIANFTNHAKTGHFYFTLKDATSSIRAVMWSRYTATLRFLPENGMNVIVRGRVQSFVRDGIYQIYCEEIVSDGIGDLQVAYEQLKRKLEAEGLFDPGRKRALPKFPSRIGVVTSKTGAALQDIINIVKRRYPVATICLFPALVQGEGAARSIVEGIENANSQADIDVLIVGRGGGSSEDLWSFNDEGVARAVAASRIPVVSAVGHEVDFTICDFVADLRAPTPSAAAELVTPDIAKLLDSLQKKQTELYNLVSGRVMLGSTGLSTLTARLKSLSPQSRIANDGKLLQNFAGRLDLAFTNKTAALAAKLQGVMQTLQAYNPLQVLQRGYSLTYDETGTIIKSVEQVTSEQTLVTKLCDGTVYSKIVMCEKESFDGCNNI